MASIADPNFFRPKVGQSLICLAGIEFQFRILRFVSRVTSGKIYKRLEFRCGAIVEFLLMKFLNIDVPRCSLCLSSKLLWEKDKPTFSQMSTCRDISANCINLSLFIGNSSRKSRSRSKQISNWDVVHRSRSIYIYVDLQFVEHRIFPKRVPSTK